MQATRVFVSLCSHLTSLLTLNLTVPSDQSCWQNSKNHILHLLVCCLSLCACLFHMGFTTSLDLKLYDHTPGWLLFTELIYIVWLHVQKVILKFFKHNCAAEDNPHLTGESDSPAITWAPSVLCLFCCCCFYFYFFS